MGEKLKLFFVFLSQASHNRTLSLVLLLTVAAMVPLTVSVLQQQQEIRQRAAECQDPETGFFVPCPEEPGECVVDSDKAELTRSCGNGKFQKLIPYKRSNGIGGECPYYEGPCNIDQDPTQDGCVADKDTLTCNATYQCAEVATCPTNSNKCTLLSTPGKACSTESGTTGICNALGECSPKEDPTCNPACTGGKVCKNNVCVVPSTPPVGGPGSGGTCTVSSTGISSDKYPQCCENGGEQFVEVKRINGTVEICGYNATSCSSPTLQCPASGTQGEDSDWCKNCKANPDCASDTEYLKQVCENPSTGGGPTSDSCKICMESPECKNNKTTYLGNCTDRSSWGADSQACKDCKADASCAANDLAVAEFCKTPTTPISYPAEGSCGYPQTCFLGDAEGIQECRGTQQGGACKYDQSGKVDPSCTPCRAKGTSANQASDLCTEFPGVGKFCMCDLIGYPKCKEGNTNPPPPSGQGRVLLSNSTPQKVTCKADNNKTVEINGNSSELMDLAGGNHTLDCDSGSSNTNLNKKAVNITPGTTTVQTISLRAGPTLPSGSCEVKVTNKDEENLNFNLLTVTFKGTGGTIDIRMGQKGDAGAETANRFSLEGFFSPNLGDAFSAIDKNASDVDSDVITVTNSFSETFIPSKFRKHTWEKKFKKTPAILDSSTTTTDFTTGTGTSYWYLLDSCDGKASECTRVAQVKIPKAKSAFFMCSVRDQTPSTDVLVCNGNPICAYNGGPDVGATANTACLAWKRSCSDKDYEYYDAPGSARNRLNIDAFYPTIHP